MIDDETILDTIEEHRPDLDAAARALVRAANKRGGEDNITVIAFEISDGGPDALERTATMPAPGASDPDEEDTLSGIEAVPVVDTMVVPPDQVEELAEVRAERDEPKPPRRRFVRRFLQLLLLLLVLAAGAYLVWRAIR
jgi:hypothetical protein